MRKHLTLAIVVRDGKILLGRKKRGIGVGLWNGLGGHVEVNETIEDAAKRECQEEAGIQPMSIKYSGVITSVYPKVFFGANKHEMHIFTVTAFSGEPVATPEMQDLTWFAPQDIPYDSMWSDDRHWLPLLLAGKRFSGTFWFDEKKKLVKWELKEQLA